MQLALTLNLHILPSVPWSLPALILLLLLWNKHLGRRWSAFDINRAIRSVNVLLYIVLSTVLCFAILVVNNAYVPVRLVAPRPPEGASYPLVVSVSILWPVIAAVVEEVGFRGILQGNLERVAKPYVAVSGVAFVFCALHVFNAGFLAQLGMYAVVALTCGMIASATRSVTPAMAIHALSNLSLSIAAMTRMPLDLNHLTRSQFWSAFLAIPPTIAAICWLLTRIRSAEAGRNGIGKNSLPV
jgi:membrane protease YdiL (CAAX protease family)